MRGSMRRRVGMMACTVAVSVAAFAAPAASAATGDGASSRTHRTVKLKSKRVHKTYVRSVAEVPSAGRRQGLHTTVDELALKSSVALVIDQSNSDVLFSKNPHVALPIASITKLMTSLVVLEANQSMTEPVEITEAELDTEKGTHSRLGFGTVLPRGELMHLALMSSENRAAHALGRTYPGGLDAFVQAMNAKAQLLGMHSSHFVDPTGLSSKNVASADDLARLVHAASQNATIRSFSTDQSHSVVVSGRTVAFRNTNSLVASPTWDIAVQKTGYIAEAGKCLVMQAIIQGKEVVIVLLDSVGKYSRVADAVRIKKWMEARRVATPVVAVAG